MPGRTPRLAFDAFAGPIRKVLSCVTHEVVQTSHDAREPGGARALALPLGRDYISLPGERGLGFMAQIEYELVRIEGLEGGPWKVKTRQYRYHVVTSDETEVILYHWHPTGNSDRTYPHLHVGQSQLTPNAVLSRQTHIPDGRTSLESVVRFLITELEVPARRDDWETVLRDCEHRFVTHRSWG